MGLDSYWSKEKDDEGKAKILALEFEPPLWLCGGMMSEHGSGSFRGKVYDTVIKRITGVSLYQEEIDNDTVRKMADALEATELSPNVSDEEDEKKEFPDLVRMFRRYADEGASLIGWW